MPDRLKLLAQQFGSASELAKQSGISNSALSRCLKGAEPTLSTAQAICTAAGVSLDWLVSGKGAEGLPDSEESVKIPFYAIEASAGAGLLPDESANATGSLALPPGIVGSHGPGAARHWFAIQAKGDSMDPTIRNGALLIVNRDDRQIREGIYVVRRGDVLLVKRTQPRENQILRLQSDNRQYEPEEIDLKDASQQFSIFGRVIWAGFPI